MAGHDERQRTYHLAPGELFEEVWPLVEPWLAAAMAENRQHLMSTEDLADGIRTKDFGLLLMRDDADRISAAAVLSRGFRPSDHAPYVALMACGGSGLDAWLPDLVDTVKATGRAFGADEIMILGRPGWRKLLAPYGGREVATMVSMTTKGPQNG
jgi:hypothetical protein